VDTVAAVAARVCGLTVIEYEPEWNRLGRFLAPFVRNTTIVEESDVLVAFWDGKSRGTMDSVVKAKDRGIKVKVIVSR